MKKRGTVAVVVGRFQTPRLHAGHLHLFRHALKLGDALLIGVGVSGGTPSTNDPMDFRTRKAMLGSYFPQATIVPVLDHASDSVWSRKLDELIVEHFPRHRVLLLGSRDSFLPHYKGKYRQNFIDPKDGICASDIRKEASRKICKSEDFRLGVIYAATHQHFPTSFQVADIVIQHSLESKVLVGRKPDEHGWRFPGGFIDPSDHSLEHAAHREALEEVGDVELAEVRYIGSFRITDHRYRKSEHKIMSALFSATYVYGRIQAQDDLAEVRWQDVRGLVDCLINTHKPLGVAYLKHRGISL